MSARASGRMSSMRGGGSVRGSMRGGGPGAGDDGAPGSLPAVFAEGGALSAAQELGANAKATAEYGGDAKALKAAQDKMLDELKKTTQAVTKGDTGAIEKLNDMIQSAVNMGLEAERCRPLAEAITAMERTSLDAKVDAALNSGDGCTLDRLESTFSPCNTSAFCSSACLNRSSSRSILTWSPLSIAFRASSICLAIGVLFNFLIASFKAGLSFGSSPSFTAASTKLWR